MNRNTRILVIEDDDGVRETLITLLGEAGYTVEAAADGPPAIALAKRSPFHLYMIDLRLPSISGIEIMAQIKKINAEAVCIVLTAYATIELSVQAMRAGAFDFISKPFQIDVVLNLVKNAIEFNRLKRENLSLKKIVRDKYRFENMVGSSQEMNRVYELIERVSDSDSTILIQGESGTGKEIVAKTIHYNSTRRDKPLIPINCGAIPEALIESELFGHEKGAFTGATNSRTGRFELAHGGTIFLDEIGELPVSLQVKLLRVLQEQSFERVGGVKSIQVDVRIVAATNQDLEKAIAEKRFREDLYYRLNVIPINIPPLRKRKDDIPLLVDHFIDKFNQKKNKKVTGITSEAIALLLKYYWPGNIRELENLVERMMVLMKDENMITTDDVPEKLIMSRRKTLPFHFELPEEGIVFAETVSAFENQILDLSLSRANGVKNRAAQLLHMNRTTLVEKLKKRRITAAAKQALSQQFYRKEEGETL
ncbi:Nitrogen regulation protein NR(I) [hydrothermal vent metagenome]|uniref:Nitrogen regulation protein NR(I) n=1 Tax=hydrothermal vent metagenome TaxID=652676 RepID=A0A3B1CIW2_9ZZZZ